jgi:hypothetical protein
MYKQHIYFNTEIYFRLHSTDVWKELCLLNWNGNFSKCKYCSMKNTAGAPVFLDFPDV